MNFKPVAWEYGIQLNRSPLTPHRVGMTRPEAETWLREAIELASLRLMGDCSMNAADIELRLHDLNTEAETSGQPIARIEIRLGIWQPYVRSTILHGKVLYLHPTDWQQLLNRYDWGLTSLTSGKYFFRGIPVYLTDPPEAASLQPMIQDDPRYEVVVEILGRCLGPYSSHAVTQEILRALDEPQKVDWVGVTFKDFDSPAEAAKWAAAKPAKIYTYYAPQRMKLTIGDVVEVEDGSRPATVVELNAPHDSTLTYKRVLKRDE